MTALTTVAGFLCAVLSTCVAPEPIPDEPVIELWPPGGIRFKCPTWMGSYAPDPVTAQISEACADDDPAAVVAGLDLMIAELTKITWDDQAAAANLKHAREERLHWQRTQLHRLAEITEHVARKEALWRYVGLTPTLRMKPPVPVLVDERLGLRPVFP